MGKQQCGNHSFVLENPPVITAWASVAGKKESEGPLANTFDITQKDSYFGEKTWEQAEKRMQQIALEQLSKKSGYFQNRFWPGIFRRSAESVYWFILYAAKYRHTTYRFVWRLLHHVRKPLAGLPCRWRRFFRPGRGNDLLPFCQL